MTRVGLSVNISGSSVAKCGGLKTNLLTIIERKTMDAQSIVSSTSSTNKEKIPCPHCNKDFGKRYMFSHIRTKHSEEFFENIGARVFFV